MNSVVLQRCAEAFASIASTNLTEEMFLSALALYLSEDSSEAAPILERLLEKRKSMGSIEESHEVLHLLGYVHLSAGELIKAEKCANEILDSDGVPERWIGLALVLLAAINRSLGHAAYALDLAQRGLDILRRAGRLVDLARACNQIGYAQMLKGELAIATGSLQTAASIAKLAGDPLIEAISTRRLGFCHIESGRYADAAGFYDRALELYKSIGADGRVSQVLHSRAVLNIRMGKFLDANENISQSFLQYSHTRGGLKLGRWEQVAGWLAVYQGRLEDAERLLLSARDRLESAKAQRDVGLCDEFLGEIFSLKRDYPEAEARFNSAINLGRQVSPSSDVVVESLRKSGELYASLGRTPEALRRAREARKLTRRYHDKLEIASIERLRGLVKLARGKTARALELLQNSWEQLERMGARLEAKVTAQLIAKVLEDDRRTHESRVWRELGGAEELPTLKLLLPAKSETATVPPPRGRVLKHLAEHAEKHGIVTRDPRVLRAFEQTVRGAPSHLPLLILGETGTGKELLAAVAHRFSERAGAFIAINCAALPPDLLDAELFGHARGAYTGALRDRPGLVESATEGTLFLDEVGEMSLPVQGRLLRAIELGEIRRLGENRPRTVTTRFVAATHRDLQQMVAQGTFRSDLFFRLRGITVVLPPLRERIWDVDMLVDYFLAREAERKGRSFDLTAEARERLRTHAWPGNVRELRTVIERLGSLHDSMEPIGVEDLELDPVRVAGSLEEHLEDEERKRLMATLESVQWNRSRAARILKLKRTTLLGKMRRLGILAPTKK